jgi:hypothetical protein
MLAVLPVKAQQVNLPVQLAHYVFDSFKQGKVLIKSGTVYEQSLNYNILTNEMIFDNGGRFMAISDPANVDTVFISGRKFVPAENKFYELLAKTTLPLFMEFTATIEEPGTSIGYGASTSTGSTTSLSTLLKSGDVYGLKLPDAFKVIPGFNFRILKEGKYLKAGSSKLLTIIFPEKKQLISELVKKNKTNFSKRDDVIVLVQQLQQ